MKRRYTKHAVPESAPADPMRIMKRGEVAALFGVTRQRVDQLASAHILRRVLLPGLSRSLGFVASEVFSLLEKRNEPQTEVKATCVRN